MTLDNIKIEYKMFTDNLWQTQSFLTDELKDLRTYFENYCKSTQYDKIFAISVEEKLIFTEMIYYNLPYNKDK